ncbi:MAG TPA: class I adenylate-forming enzyme family protein [Steroidobacteraceae bacterium]|jgi:acyl-CoA synthetase (AMP-forming)/AMP-acid ligase II|nr:class I adenylate-forming enzyme family protein [Steroidobacteraceae bacterium]
MAWFQAPRPLLPDLIEQNGRWLKGRQALIDGTSALSWAQFADATSQVANGLKALGVEPHERVAVLMDNRLETVLALFGIVRAGAVAVPLNVSINDAAVAAMCTDADCVAVFASGHHCARIDGLRSSDNLGARHFVGYDAPHGGWLDFREFVAAQTPAVPAVAIAPDDECNLIYSSGTTALPKGIIHTHACRMHWAYDAGLVLRYRSGCRTLITLGLFSNITWVTMLATILVGGTLVLARAFNPREALALIEAERITHGAFVPVQLERLLACPERGAFRTDSLETLMCCGSPLRPEIKRGFAREFDCDLIELYGLTEGLMTILEPEELERKVLSVGKPVLGADIRILGDDDHEVAPGETGEIVGRGRLVMAGYHARDEASREATWIDPVGAQWLRTGDLGRVDSEGFLYIVDRKKDMILSGGQNIYPADIETVLLEHAAVAEAAVIGIDSERWGETPLAVVVLHPGHSPSAAELLDWANARVGRQQRLSGVVSRDSLPRNANGKVLKRELRREYASLNVTGGKSI